MCPCICYPLYLCMMNNPRCLSRHRGFDHPHDELLPGRRNFSKGHLQLPQGFVSSFRSCSFASLTLPLSRANLASSQCSCREDLYIYILKVNWLCLLSFGPSVCRKVCSSGCLFGMFVSFSGLSTWLSCCLFLLNEMFSLSLSARVFFSIYRISLSVSVSVLQNGFILTSVSRSLFLHLSKCPFLSLSNCLSLSSIRFFFLSASLRLCFAALFSMLINKKSRNANDVQFNEIRDFREMKERLIYESTFLFNNF